MSMQIGGARGPGGATLDALLSELQAIREALADIASAGGQPELTDCGLTQLELLCSINTAIVGPAAPDGPAARCPGFETAPIVAVSAGWHRYTSTESGLSTFWDCELMLQGSPPGLSIVQYYEDPGVIDLPTYHLVTDTPATNLCVAWHVPDGGYVAAVISGDEPGGYGSVAPLNSELQTGDGSSAFVLNASQSLHIYAYIPGGAPLTFGPAASIWLLQGPYG